MKTFWNGEPCKATKVKVVVGKSPRPTWWCAHLEGKIMDAIRIEYPVDNKTSEPGIDCQPFYLCDDAESWKKITVGMGSPYCSHKSLPVKEEVIL
ncbi:hypothetical protein [Bdellovibrio bacteriovorus]|uniref:hypothetical protein n=1 Tax=Bdellovibrio bacteriovorus TaxID=959 RepID=UPI0035A6BF35